VIVVVAPDSWIGASMKFAGTLPMIVVPAFWLLVGKTRGRLWVFILLAAVLAGGALLLSGEFGRALKSLGGGILGSLIVGIGAIAVLAVIGLLIVLWWREGSEGLGSRAFASPWAAIAVFAFAVLVRGAVTVVSNYYYAGPVFFGISANEFIAAFPWWIIFGWNVLQGAVEFWVAWVVAYEFGLVKRYGKW
jgi:hypothetical protein